MYSKRNFERKSFEIDSKGKDVGLYVKRRNGVEMWLEGH